LAHLPGDPARRGPPLPRLRFHARPRLPRLSHVWLDRQRPLPLLRPPRPPRLALLPLLRSRPPRRRTRRRTGPATVVTGDAAYGMRDVRCIMHHPSSVNPQGAGWRGSAMITDPARLAPTLGEIAEVAAVAAAAMEKAGPGGCNT